VHIALNIGLPLVDPRGGFFFVSLSPGTARSKSP
jgi:hypothetical protein